MHCNQAPVTCSLGSIYVLKWKSYFLCLFQGTVFVTLKNIYGTRLTKRSVFRNVLSTGTIHIYNLYPLMQYYLFESDRLYFNLWQKLNFLSCHIKSQFFSYNSDLDSDPYGDCLWYFNFFFYNKKMKRILFFSCQAHP